MTGPLATLLLASAVLAAEPPTRPTRPVESPADTGTVTSTDSKETVPARPDDKTLVASLDAEQGRGKDRLSLYRDGTLALARTYSGVLTVKKKLLSAEEVDLIGKVCSEALVLDVEEYAIDVLGRTEPRAFRIEVGRPDGPPRVFRFDEMSRIPLPLGRARGALEGLMARFDESTVSQGDLWDPALLRSGDVLRRRSDGRRFRVARDDLFVRSLEIVEEDRGLERLLILREEVPKIFLDPASVPTGSKR